MSEEIRTLIEPWLASLSPGTREAEINSLQGYIWGVHKRLKPKADTNKARKIASRKRELALNWHTPRANRAPEMAEREESFYIDCMLAMARIAREGNYTAYGLYVPQVFHRRKAAFFAVWQLRDGSWVTPSRGCRDKDTVCFEELYATLIKERVPLSLAFDETCFIENGEIE